MINNDRQITITTGNSRRATTWRPQTLLLSEFWERLRVPARGQETLAAYMAMKKGQQDDLKDVGGYVAGTLRGERRKAGAVVSREIITLDADSIPAGGTNGILAAVAALGCGYCVYSTRKHAPAAPRLRILLPLDRAVTADEYEPCARKIAQYIDPSMRIFDPSTFEPSRLMYWPSCCVDSEYIYTWEDKPLLSADGLLGQYADWHDLRSWPEVPGAVANPQRLAARQGDPTTKPGVVGAFCRVYDIYRAMDTFLPGIYEPTDTGDDRYTFTGGSTAGGAVVYDSGKFLFSHHATDPCSGRLVNAFDLVRLHLYGDQDDDADAGTPTNRLPSYTAACALAVADNDVAALLARERSEEAAADFEGVMATNDTDAANWTRRLKLNKQSGLPDKTMDNIWIILENDPLLAGKFALNTFAGRGEILDALPWNTHKQRRFWDDNDNQGLYWYLEKYYGITGSAKVDGSLSLHSTKYAFNDVQGYLSKLEWDGTPRLDTLLVDFLGAEDTELTRAITRKAFTAAVARAMTPGVKFDYMTILSGPQGIGKSTLLYKMSHSWFNDSIRTFEGKDASELLQGVWLVEISELEAFRKTDASRIKQFLSLQVDRFRAAYGRHVKDLPRCCVFFGTTNSAEYLQDRTGNRRFWPVDVGVHVPKFSVFDDLDDVRDQLWAEAVIRWKLGEPLYIGRELEKMAQDAQEDHRESSTREGLITDFLARDVPDDWCRWDAQQRQTFWAGTTANRDGLHLVKRDRVCAAEVWGELFNGSQKDFRYADAREINDILASLPGWKKAGKPLKFGPYGAQRGYILTGNNADNI